jgi:hypothetical protein
MGNPEVRNRQELTGIDRNFHISDGKSRSKEQTGIDRILYLI